MKRSVLQEDIIVLNVYVINSRVSKYMRKKLIDVKGEIDKAIIIIGDFTMHL